VYSGNLYGGVERMLTTFATCRHLVPEMEPEFGLCFRGRLWDELSAIGVPVHDLGAVRASRPWTVWRARRELRRLLKDRRIEAVLFQANWAHAIFAPVVRAAHVRLATFAQDARERPSVWDRWAGRSPPDLVLANSRYTAGTVGCYMPGVPVEVVYPPVPETAVGDRCLVREQVRAELGTPADAVVLLQASRLERWKGPAVYVEALGRLRDVAGWTAWLAGGAQKGDEAAFLEELRRSADRLGIADRIRFLGQRSDVARLMAAADVFCQPNTAPEPFGIVFVEALLAGLPVVTTDIGGGKEIVTDDCGIRVPPGDPAAVAAALGALVEDTAMRTALGSAGPARAREVSDPARQLRIVAAALRAPDGVPA
jgi:glycosyltransferase involved in cell wall biosynthesis